MWRQRSPSGACVRTRSIVEPLGSLSNFLTRANSRAKWIFFYRFFLAVFLTRRRTSDYARRLTTSPMDIRRRCLSRRAARRTRTGAKQKHPVVPSAFASTLGAGGLAHAIKPVTTSKTRGLIRCGAKARERAGRSSLFLWRALALLLSLLRSRLWRHRRWRSLALWLRAPLWRRDTA